MKKSSIFGLAICVAIVGCNPVGRQLGFTSSPKLSQYMPLKPSELNLLLTQAFKETSRKEIPGELRGLLMPHAALRMVGVMQAMAARMLQGKNIETVYILAPSYEGAPKGAVVWWGRGFKTPLGRIAIDRDAVGELLTLSKDLRFQENPWRDAHAIETQLPFIQKVAPQVKIIPINVGVPTWEEAQSIAKAIAQQALKRKSLLIIVSNLSHFPSYQDAEKIDRLTLSRLLELSPEKLEQTFNQIQASGAMGLLTPASGPGTLLVGMLALLQMGVNEAHLIRYANSGEITNERKRVVGYASMAFAQRSDRPAKSFVLPQETVVKLSTEEKNELLRLARSAVVEGLANQRQLNPVTNNMRLLQRHPVFVTLREGGLLRGCMGLTDARFPLAQATARMACDAAFHDPRFKPVTNQDLPFLEIEISVLSPMKKIASIQEIILGVHGVMIAKNGQTAMYLPQVAVDTGWTKEQFLNNLCSKQARLPEHAWQEKDAELFIFTVQSFKEIVSQRGGSAVFKK